MMSVRTLFQCYSAIMVLAVAVTSAPESMDGESLGSLLSKLKGVKTTPAYPDGKSRQEAEEVVKYLNKDATENSMNMGLPIPTDYGSSTYAAQMGARAKKLGVFPQEWSRYSRAQIPKRSGWYPSNPQYQPQAAEKRFKFPDAYSYYKKSFPSQGNALENQKRFPTAYSYYKRADVIPDDQLNYYKRSGVVPEDQYLYFTRAEEGPEEQQPIRGWYDIDSPEYQLASFPAGIPYQEYGQEGNFLTPKRMKFLDNGK